MHPVKAIILDNAIIHTLDDRNPLASTVIISNDRIVMVGKALETPAITGSHVETIRCDMKGRTILPGFIDAHLHLKKYSLGLRMVDCETSTKGECLRRVQKRVEQLPAGAWVLGHGWNQNVWEEGYGNTLDLDEISQTHPIYLTAKSLHAGWANSIALQIAGIDKSSADPEDGLIQRDHQGHPTGILFEGAMRLVASQVAKPNQNEIILAIDHAQKRLAQMGVTGVHDFDRRDCFVALQALHQQEKLKLRVLKSIPLEDLDHAVSMGIRSGFGDDLLKVGSLKIFADGALGPRTAAMIDPYQDEPDNFGMLLVDGEELVEIGQKAVKNEISLAVHAIGDKANHEVLNALSQLREFESLNRISPLRHRIEHVQVLHPDDLRRLADLDVIASMQPVHATSDMHMADRFWGKRAALAYAWKSLHQQKTRLVFGSDAPVESPNPFWGIHAAVTRQNRDIQPGGDRWYGEQRLSVYDAIVGYTREAAYAAGMESKLGRIRSGYLADLIVLEQDPFDLAPEKLWEIEPVATMIGGDWVHGEEQIELI